MSFINADWRNHKISAREKNKVRKALGSVDLGDFQFEHFDTVDVDDGQDHEEFAVYELDHAYEDDVRAYVDLYIDAIKTVATPKNIGWIAELLNDEIIWWENDFDTNMEVYDTAVQLRSEGVTVKGMDPAEYVDTLRFDHRSIIRDHIMTRLAEHPEAIAA